MASVAEVAKRFGLTEQAVKELLEMPTDVLVAREVARGKVPSNETGSPAPAVNLPLGSASVDPWGELGERYVNELREMDAALLRVTEPEDGIRAHETYRTYLAWARAGHIAPPVSVAETANGFFNSCNRRRTLVAQELGQTVLAWFSPHNPETGLPLKYGDVLRAAGRVSFPEQQ